MIIALNALIFITVIYLQSSLLGRFDIFGLVPNLVLILIVAFALFRKTYEAYIFAFISGLILDTISGGPFGLHTAILMLVVFISSLVVDEDHTKISNVFPTMLLGIITFIFYTTLWLFVSFGSKNFTINGLIFSLGQVAITVVFFIILFPYLKKMFLWESKIDKIKGK
ncbi:MAG: rod shape-determining protein MreD [bacterium]|nr:rod shape-determining protein MreD [bacterium]